MCKRWQSTIYGGTERVLYSTQVHIHSMGIGMWYTYKEKGEGAGARQGWTYVHTL